MTIEQLTRIAAFERNEDKEQSLNKYVHTISQEDISRLQGSSMIS